MATASTLSGIALVTGAASGIGKETALTFAETGVSGVVFADVNYEDAQQVAETSRGYATNPNYRPLAIKVDILDVDSIQSMVDAAVKEFGRIDYLVTAAGVANRSLTPINDIQIEEFNRIVDINLKGVVYTIRAVSTAMIAQEPIIFTSPSARHKDTPPRDLGRGSIINLGSSYSLTADYGMFGYITSKCGIIGVTRSAAVDLAPHGIRVNAILPGPVATPMMITAVNELPGFAQAIKKRVLLGGRMAETAEIASVIMFLCGSGASYITGSPIPIDAGFALGTSAVTDLY